MAESANPEKLITENETARVKTFTEKTGAVLSKDAAVKKAEEKAAKAPDPTRKFRLGLIALGVFALAELLGMLYLLLINAEKANQITDLKTNVEILEARLRGVESASSQLQPQKF